MEKKDYYIAVDLGSSKVVVMVGEKTPDNKLRIVDFAEAPMPSQAFLRGEIRNIELVVSSLNLAVSEISQRLNINFSEVFTGMTGQHIKCAKHSYFVYVGSDGEIVQKDIDQLHESMQNVQVPEGEKILAILPQDYIVNEKEHVRNPVGMFSKTLKAIFNFILGGKLAVERQDKALSRAQLTQKKLYINPLVASEAVVLDEEKEMGVAVVDLGAGTTDLTIYSEGTVAHLAIIPLGADTINKDLKEYGIVERSIEQLKLQCGCAIAENVSEDKFVLIQGRASKEVSVKNIAGIIEARMNDILDYVLSEIKLAGFEDRLPAGIILTGGGAKLAQVDELIKNYMSYDVRFGTPLDAKISDDSIDIAKNLSLSTAIGILCAAISDNEKPCNYTLKPTVKQEVKPKIEEPVQQEQPKREEQKPSTETMKPEKKAAGWFNKFKGKVSEFFDYIDDDAENGADEK